MKNKIIIIIIISLIIIILGYIIFKTIQQSDKPELPPTTPLPPEQWLLMNGIVQPVVNFGNDSFIIVGNTGGNVTLPMTEGGYYFSFKFKNHLQLVPVNNTLQKEELVSESNAFCFSDEIALYRYNEMSRVLHWNSTGNQTFAIDANGPFQISINKFPLNTIAYPPGLVKSNGWMATYQSIFYDAGIANLSIECLDTKQSEFTATLKDGSSGYSLGVIATNIIDNKMINNINITKTMIIPKTGPFIIEVYANKDATYTIALN